MSESTDPGITQMVGCSPAMLALERQIAAAARCHAKVLVTGETGSGKELVTPLIHHRGPRTLAPLLTLNCAGLPDALLESELFGHVRGSFTGAQRDKAGLLEMAPNGTVCLDEVGEMSPRLQALLLRFLETGEIRRIGAEHGHSRADVRVITATNRDLTQQIATGAFREDLYFRLNVLRVCVPPLREREGDVPLLVSHFLQRYAAEHGVPRPDMSMAAMNALNAYRWPGNVRELKNVIERLVLQTPGRIVRLADLPVDVVAAVSSDPATGDRPGGHPPQPVADELIGRIFDQGESFWSVVYPAFMKRDCTRRDLRAVVTMGLQRTKGNYRTLVELFHMPPSDYKRFHKFLRTHECHMPFRSFRTVSSSENDAVATPFAVAPTGVARKRPHPDRAVRVG